MNKQPLSRIGRVIVREGIEWTHVPGYAGYTCNPVTGCAHECRWEMPDGTIVICYAKYCAECSPAKVHYPGGFQVIRFHPDRLDSIKRHREPCAIFLDSMSDLMGQGVEDAWIEQILNTMRACPRHIFQILTKNPTRLPKFAFPQNCWVGISAPPTWMFGKHLSLSQQQTWYDRGLAALSRVDVPVRWTSIEPLSWDVSEIISKYRDHLNWAVIGAGTNGATAYQPEESVFHNTLQALKNVPVFFKGNLDRKLANLVAGQWREEFPAVVMQTRRHQAAMTKLAQK